MSDNRGRSLNTSKLPKRVRIQRSITFFAGAGQNGIPTYPKRVLQLRRSACRHGWQYEHCAAHAPDFVTIIGN
ncbi:hypothetical protein [Streptomyces albipurpureus]|uniref:Uncharacterized protein n=1 Tax=Streptomyces albipurpureus TaxID=2897419 RepID=A0ABT0UVC7_9ACTN|nr:hypothetical protein [Streptomyces sp. CWNU-1]MCM2392060.1 hypothetical protein [Streptomyces sp. CWNU-1]